MHWKLEPDPTGGDTFKDYKDVIAYLEKCENLPPTVIWEYENESLMEPVYLWLHNTLYEINEFILYLGLDGDDSFEGISSF